MATRGDLTLQTVDRAGPRSIVSAALDDRPHRLENAVRPLDERLSLAFDATGPRPGKTVSLALRRRPVGPFPLDHLTEGPDDPVDKRRVEDAEGVLNVVVFQQRRPPGLDVARLR